jgi:hypothetical protein
MYLQDYRKRENIFPDAMVPAVLGVDATPVSATGIDHNWSNESCLTFILLPVDHRLPGLPVQSTRYSSSEINQNIRDAHDVLLQVIKASRFLCHFVATDGDSGVNESHDAAFQKYANLNQSNLDSIFHTLTEHGHKEFEDWPIADLLHLMKNARSRKALGPLAFNRGTQDIVTGKSLTKTLLKDHKQFFEACKPLDLLNDDLAIQAFTLEHLLSVWTGAGRIRALLMNPTSWRPVGNTA